MCSFVCDGLLYAYTSATAKQALKIAHGDVQNFFTMFAVRVHENQKLKRNHLEYQCDDHEPMIDVSVGKMQRYLTTKRDNEPIVSRPIVGMSTEQRGSNLTEENMNEANGKISDISERQWSSS